MSKEVDAGGKSDIFLDSGCLSQSWSDFTLDRRPISLTDYTLPHKHKVYKNISTLNFKNNLEIIEDSNFTNA